MIEKNYNFQKLTPIRNVDLQIYDDAINFVFSNDDIKNVAISGPYSAGKSSLIETYKSNHKEYSFLHISLAHFVENDKDKGVASICSEADLEGKILNQLIHQIDPENIPQTNFKVKQKISNDNIIKNTIFIITFLFLATYMLNFDKWSKFVSTISQQWVKNILINTTNSAGVLLSGVISSFLLFYAVYSFIKAQKNKNILKKVKLQGNEIEIFEEKDESYFDKYLNEVLYLFENSDADVIVFEDIDRYNKNQIFEKLREINNIINNRGKKLIRFFYLLRDDIFITKDRTKFFDFIIPVVPVIDSSNSYDQFIEHFKKGGIFDLFNENFLQGLSLYVDDMRILKNIYNEFVIYHNRLQSTELNINKLLAIIVYKNIFPRDFSDLQLGMGFVHTLFENKPIFLKQELEKIESRIEEINDDIQSSNKELLNTIDELDAAYLLANFQIHSIDGINISVFKTRAELVQAIMRKPNEVQLYTQYYGVQSVDMTNEVEQLLRNPKYVKRKEDIERKMENRIEKFKVELQKMLYRKSIIQNIRLHEIITRENINSIFSVDYTNEIGETNNFNEIKSSPYFDLIKYLIRYGHIDETYSDYMTYFYANSLSLADKLFLRSVTDQVPREYSYSLKNPELIVSRLRVVDFECEEILNFDLLSYLLKDKKNNETYLERFFKQLIDTKNFKFIGDFLERQKEIDALIESINNIWPGIFQYILNESNFSDEQKKKYAIYTLYFSTDADIMAVNINSSLSTFISKDPFFLEIVNPEIDKIINGFTLIDVKFQWIDYNSSNKELFESVYKYNLYQLTFDMICLILEKFYNYPIYADYKTKNYTLVSSKPDEPLVSYVNNNINCYIDIIIENCNKSINDDESIVLTILNHPDVDIELKQKYIGVLQTIIERIRNVKYKELWNLLLEQRIVKYSEYNILDYFYSEDNGMDDFLIDFIESDNTDLNFDYNLIDSEFGDNEAAKFYESIVMCRKLSNEKYESILLNFNRVYKSFPFKELPGEKILILIKLKVIQMTSENLIFMRGNYPEQLVPFIIKNISQYNTEVINEENYVFDEMLKILDTSVPDEYKINLLQYATAGISVSKVKYSETVKLHILENNLDINDIPILIRDYSLESDGIKQAIERIAREQIDEIVNEEYSINLELLKELFASGKLSIETQKQLFALCLLNMNEKQAKEYLMDLKMKDYLSLFDRKRSAKFERNSINEKILKVFDKKKWIEDFEIDKNDQNFYRTYVRKTDNAKLPVEIL